MSIIRFLSNLVNPLFRSWWFWGLVLVLVFLLWSVKGDVSRMAKILKLLAKMVVQVVALVLALFGIEIDRFNRLLKEGLS